LWQTTLLVVMVALLTLRLKENRAQVRYALWLIASLKFLAPYSLLVAAGSYLSWLHPLGAENRKISFLIRGPFGAGAMADTNAANGLSFGARPAPVVLLGVWAIGAVAVLFFWWLRWHRTKSILREAAPLTDGRAFDTLRRLEKASGTKRRMALVSGAINLEPGVVGIFRPVLFLPAGVSKGLSQEQLESILIHELCHVRRQDNLAAALHLLVECLFWFHPLAWWIGARMMEERERACDEDVLARGSDPRTYAESILRVCELRLGTPPALMAGVSGAKLIERIEAIMSEQPATKLDVSRRAFLATMGIAAVVGPVAAGVLSPRESGLEASAQSAAQSGTKYVLGEIRIEGEVHDREAIQERILNEWQGREYSDASQLADSVMREGVRIDFQSRGYFKAVASDPVTQTLGRKGGKQGIRVVTSVQEGAQYRLGTLAFQNADAGKPLSIPAETLREQIHLRSGDVVNLSEAHEGMERIKKLYGAKNFGAELVPEVSIDDQRHIIDAVFRVKETAKGS
jgi:beta-lactamase regulating signal transducer with metallopeptidase domain